MAERRPNRTLGGVHDDFWRYCGAGQLRLQRCVGCSVWRWPPSGACEECGTAESTWELLSGEARLVSWCTFEHRYFPHVPLPWDAILVRLREGPLFLSNPVGFGPAGMEADMALRVEFLDCEDDAGPFRLPAFRPA